MPTHKGFTTWISCEGKVLEEFETRFDADGIKVTCWIPSEAGKHFSIHWQDHGSQIPSAAYISLDGCTVSGRFLWGSGATFRSGVRSGPCTERPFSFAKIEKTTSRPSQVPPAHEIGTIILRIKQVQRGDPRTPNRYQVLPPPLSQEWSGTTGGVCTTFGREVAYYEQYPQTWSAHPWDATQPGSFAKFVFRYRPLDFLQAQGIATATSTGTVPAPVPPSPMPGAVPVIPGFGAFAVANNVKGIYSMYTAPSSVPVSAPSSSTTPVAATPSPAQRKVTPRRPSTRKPSGASSRSVSASSVTFVMPSVPASASASMASSPTGSLKGKETATADSTPRAMSPVISDTSTSRLFSEFLNFGDEDENMDVS
ncbi:hypothetical protein BD410DRAFT_785599 [Rickenella mellea]|uniref:DUF7918 domain-containing protein n=1 Tax=Rickenella mellea TaxID=50990 RepID=A0A4Y7QBA4_9AGAM|nr:hypothetical protein BD410DRAFT_785599 [Rickenella mellea]